MKRSCQILLYFIATGVSRITAFVPSQVHEGSLSARLYGWTAASTSSKTKLSMGLLDSLSKFLQKREGDFVKLEETDSAYGPGPALVLYKVPAGIEDEEVYDMLQDGAPKASAKGVSLARIADNYDKLLDMTVKEAMEQVVAFGMSAATRSKADDETPVLSTQMNDGGCPVLFFSGIDNAEMMATYNILGKEIFDESYGTINPACAKAVPNAMNKPLRQVMEEISGDHMDAMSLDQSDT
jgi:hypothetical protein